MRYRHDYDARDAVEMTEASAFWSLPGVWMAVAGAAFMLFNAVRSWKAPQAFATYLGLPLADDRDSPLVRVYALRALFIGIAFVALLVVHDIRALCYVVFAAIPMPIGDAWLTSRGGAKRATVARHIAIAAFLLVAGALLVRVS